MTHTAEVQPRAWYTVGLLTFLYGLSFTDRMILALLAEPVGKALALSDGQLGLLLGAGFAVVYSIGSVPIADLIDRGNRVLLVSLGVLLWSATTMGSALATGFVVLLFLRAGVALGEAVLTPAAVSLVGDLFPRAKRSLPMAIYASMASIMSTGAFIVGGAVLALAETFEAALGFAAWRSTFVMVGVPGIVVGLLMLATVRDPRHGRQDRSVDDAVPFSEMIRYVWHARGFYLPFYIGAGVATVNAMGTLSWVATLLIRNHSQSAMQAGYYIGLIGIPAGIVSSTVLPALNTWRVRRGHNDGALIALLLGAVLATVFVSIGMIQQELSWFLGSFFFAMVGLASIGVMAPIAIQTVGPRPIRARLTSLYLLATSLGGYSLGPIVVVAFADLWPSDPRALSYGCALNGLFAGALSIVLLGVAWRAVRRLPTLQD